MVHKISDSLSGVLHLPARRQGVLLDHPATGDRVVSTVQSAGPCSGIRVTHLPPPQAFRRLDLLELYNLARLRRIDICQRESTYWGIG